MSQHLSRVQNLTNAHSIAIIYLHQNNGKTSGTSCRVKHREICPIERHHFDLKSDFPSAPDLFQAGSFSKVQFVDIDLDLGQTWHGCKLPKSIQNGLANLQPNRYLYIYTLSVQTLRICRVWSETLGLPMMIVNTSCLHVKPRVSQHVLRILPSPGCQLGGAWLSSVSRHVGGTYLWYNIL